MPKQFKLTLSMAKLSSRLSELFLTDCLPSFKSTLLGSKTITKPLQQQQQQKSQHFIFYRPDFGHTKEKCPNLNL